MMNISPTPPASLRRGFSLIEVTLAIGIVGIAILSLVGILGSTFQQVDDIMQTNRALSGVTRLVSALDNPRGIIWLNPATPTATTTTYLHQGRPALDDPAPASNFDIVYRLLAGASDTQKAVWLYVYERKLVLADKDAEVDGAALKYNLNSNPAIMEVACSADAGGDEFSIRMAAARNVIGSPMRVRLTLSKLLVGQRVRINAATGEPDPLSRYKVGDPLPSNPNDYALAYLPVVAEFFPHDFSGPLEFKSREEAPLLVQNIVISR